MRNDFAATISSSVRTTTTGAASPAASISAAARLVEGSANSAVSSSANDPAWTWPASAERNAARAALRLTLSSKLRGVLAKMWPPPVNCPARIVPARARPVPFWRQGLARPPETSPRLLLANVPARCALSSARTASWTRWGLISAAKIASASETSRAARAARVEHGCLRRGHQPRTSTRPFLGPGTAPLTSSRFRVGSTSCTVTPSWVTRLPPIRPAILMPLNTREGVAEAPIEPGARTLCEPWARGPLEKLWRLIVPWKPLPIPIPETLIASPGCEELDRHRLAGDRALDPAAELDQRAVGADAEALEVAALGLAELAGGHRVEGELHRLVAVELARSSPGRPGRARRRSPSRA